MPQVPAGCPRKCCGMGRAKRGYRLNRARASASNPRLTRYASHCSVEDCSGPSRIALGSGTLLAVLASARLLRLYGRLNFIEFSWEKVAYRRRFSRSSPPAQGFAPTAFPHTPGGCLQILANAGAAKNGPMRELGRLGGGLIGVSVARGTGIDTLLLQHFCGVFLATCNPPRRSTTHPNLQR
jgi:hypothetical protein